MIKAYVYKAVSAMLELPARLCIYNRSMPPVGGLARDVPYGSESRRKQSLDVFIPRGEPPFPVLVHIHGGGFHFMDKKSSARTCAWFAHRGYLVFNVNYRLAPAATFPVQFEDIARAVSWVRDNAGRYGGNDDGFFMAGGSAGAYFAAMYAAAAADREIANALSIPGTVPLESIRGLLLFYGVYDMETVFDTGFPLIEFMARGFMGRDPAVYNRRADTASPARHVAGSYPPSIIFSGERDRLHPQSVEFDRALTAAGVEHRTLFFDRTMHPEAIHGFLNFFFLGCAGIAMEAAVRFMDEMSAREDHAGGARGYTS